MPIRLAMSSTGKTVETPVKRSIKDLIGPERSSAAAVVVVSPEEAVVSAEAVVVVVSAEVVVDVSAEE